jgi:PIN domain nuclease of toxin-antitoxin system
MQRLGIRALDISHRHALAAGRLPGHHRDPFDRMLIAQALDEDMVLMTADRVFEKYDAPIFWCAN